MQIGTPGDQDLFIGVKAGGIDSDAPIQCLPFFKGAESEEAARYDVEGKSATQSQPKLIAYSRNQITRQYGWSSDAWKTEDLTFSIYTPFFPVPETDASQDKSLSILPAVIAELTIDNTAGKQHKTGVFAIRFANPGVRTFDETAGFAWRNEMGVRATVVGSGKCEIQNFMRWKVEEALGDINPVHGLGNTPGVAFTVPAGEKATLRMAIGVYLDQVVTTRIEGKYLYTRHFSSLNHVLESALNRFDELKQQAQRQDAELLASKLSADQQWLIAHATRSYHGSTQLLDVGGEPFWIVNEGEYCMMNTLDLSVDHVFWELKQHPWLVKNLLDRFVRHYSYVDQIKVPKSGSVMSSHVQQSDAEALGGTPRVLGQTQPMEAFDLKPGGISFCHDMGVHNQFSRQQYSSYEMPNLVGCFSYMTCEELCNWILIATSYVSHTNDLDWARHNQATIRACLQSLANRSGEAGFVTYDSTRCATGAEITTYDSLDHSLAQTRNNLYMAIKCWACYLGLKQLLSQMGDDSVLLAEQQANRCVETVLKNVSKDGAIPAVFEKDNPGYLSRILPAIEGLVYPAVWGTDVSAYKSLYAALSKHTLALMADPQKRNLFADGGIKLSSTSDNSWMSKIALFQYVCTKVLKLDSDPTMKTLLATADTAHVKWMTEGESAYWACSDQFVSGVAKGSKYYPRIVTSVLWM